MDSYKNVSLPNEISAQLLDLETEEFVDAVIVSAFTEKILDELDAWPKNLAASLMVNGSEWDDSHWNWRQLFKTASRAYPNQNVEFYAVLVNNMAQGAMMLTHPYDSKRKHPMQTQVLHVERIAAAPSNRNHQVDRKAQYKGVGRVLMATAGARSKDLGLNGYVSLLSVAKAVNFYKEIGMVSYKNEVEGEVEVDHEFDLVYFESIITEGYLKND